MTDMQISKISKDIVLTEKVKMKEFTGGEVIIAGNDILGIPYNKIMNISDGYYINTIPKAAFIMAQKKHQNMQMIQIQPHMTLSEVKGCFFNYVVMVRMKRTPIDKKSQYKFFSTIDISDIKQIITDINEHPMLLASMRSTSTYNFAQAFIIKYYMKYLLKKLK